MILNRAAPKLRALRSPTVKPWASAVAAIRLSRGAHARASVVAGDAAPNIKMPVMFTPKGCSAQLAW